jgi:hypothetical protein
MVCVYPFLSTNRSGYLILFESLSVLITFNLSVA